MPSSPTAATDPASLDFAALLGDATRLLQVRTALPDLALVPEQATMREAVGQPFELVLDCVSVSPRLALESLVGEQMTVRLRQPGGGYRPWHGYVVRAAQLGSDGGLARYRFTMGPWLAWLALRLDSRVFRDRTALEIVEEVFADYPAARWRLRADAQTLAAQRRRSLCMQYRETDLAFVTRLLAQEGLHFWFEHPDAEAGRDAGAQDRARHVLVIADARAGRDELGPIRFAAQTPRTPGRPAPDAADPIDSFAAERRLTANAVALGSWDPGRLAGVSARAASALALGEVPVLEAYDGAGACRFPDAAAAERAAAQALAAAELAAKRFAGTGAARVLRAGACFSLVDHPNYGADASAAAYAGAGAGRGDNAFTVLAVEHTVRNNLGSAAARLLGRDGLEHGRYRNRFACVLRAVPVVPPCPRAPTAPAALSARVVGVEGAAVHGDRGHRVQVRMHFEPDPPPGGREAGTWVRVAGPAAGAGWGAVYTPRVGTEVVLQFLDGDIDRPVVAGGLYRGTDAVPFAAGIGSGANHAGVLSGLHSRALAGGGFNQLALDDAPGQLRVRLHSSHAGSELGLGHLIQHAGHSSWRGAARGAGFEAATAGWGSVRAAQGLLLSAAARPGTYASARGTQMDAGEAVARLVEGRALGGRLGAAARAAEAQGLASHDDGQALDALLQAVDPQRAGRHPASVRGQPALQPGPDGRIPGDAPVPAFDRPVVLFDTPAAFLAASEASVTHYAGRSLGLTARGDLQQTAAQAASFASGRTASFYAHQGGLRAVAAQGPVSLRAHGDALRILADASVRVASVEGEIRIAAQERIELVAGASSITLAGGDIEIRTPGAFTVRGATHAFDGPERLPARLDALPEGATGQAPHAIEVSYHDEALVPLAGYPYRIVFAGGTCLEGTLDANGCARHDGVPNEAATVYYGDSPAAPRIAAVTARQPTEAALADDLRRLGLDAAELDAVVQRESGRTA